MAKTRKKMGFVQRVGRVPISIPKKQSIRCNVVVDTWDFSGRDVWLPPNRVYELTIDYPLSNPAVIKVRTGERGLGFAGLMTKIVKGYRRVYKQEDTSIERAKAKGDFDGESRWGIWGHNIGDLAIEGMDINHEKRKIRLRVGS